MLASSTTTTSGPSSGSRPAFPRKLAMVEAGPETIVPFQEPLVERGLNKRSPAQLGSLRTKDANEPVCQHRSRDARVPRVEQAIQSFFHCAAQTPVVIQAYRKPRPCEVIDHFPRRPERDETRVFFNPC